MPNSAVIASRLALTYKQYPFRTILRQVMLDAVKHSPEDLSLFDLADYVCIRPQNYEYEQILEQKEGDLDSILDELTDSQRVYIEIGVFYRVFEKEITSEIMVSEFLSVVEIHRPGMYRFNIESCKPDTDISKKVFQEAVELLKEKIREYLVESI